MPGFTVTLDRLQTCLTGVEPLVLTGMALSLLAVAVTSAMAWAVIRSLLAIA